MILIFDLDDTLYPEITFVESGFRAVATYLKNLYGLDYEQSLEFMELTLRNHGRGKIFDLVLLHNGLYTASRVTSCINEYRAHIPDIKPYPSALTFLSTWKSPLYLVTDGNKLVQATKINALNINTYFKKIFITHRYGLHRAKPSPYYFDLLKNRKCTEDLIYVADNPKKDFVSLNLLGSVTVRVLTGHYRSYVAAPGYDAKFTINSLAELSSFLAQLF